MTISHCVASGNAYGLDAQVLGLATGTTAKINVDSCQVANNSADGIVIGGFNDIGALPLILVSNSTVVDNGGIGLHGGVGPSSVLMGSLGNNMVYGNAGGDVVSDAVLDPN